MGKKIKKLGKSIGKALKSGFKSVWNGVRKLVEGLAGVIVDALKTVWDKLIMPIIDWLAGLLGFKDKDMIAVAANTQPLYEEEKAWLFNDNIILKSRLQDTDVVDEMRSTILDGRHNNARGYHRYGEASYSRGLPSILFTAGTSTKADDSALGMWYAHCELYGYPKTHNKIADTPTRDRRFDIVTVPTEDLIVQGLVEAYGYHHDTGVMTVDGTEYEVQWGSLNEDMYLDTSIPDEGDGTFPTTPDQEAMEVDVYNLEWAVSAIGLGEYIKPIAPTIEGTLLTAKRLNSGRYTINDEPVHLISSDGFTLELSEVSPTEFPLIIGYIGYVYYESPAYWAVTRTVDIIPPEVEGDPDIEIVTYGVVAGPVETDSTKVPSVRQFDGTIHDALVPSIQFTFYVTDPAYTPYPNDLNYQFIYTVPEDRLTENDFSGGGADGSAFANYSEDFFDALPVVVLKEEGTWIDSNKAGPEYITSDKLLSKVGLQVQPLVDAIRDSDGGADKDLQTAVFRLGVDILTKNQGCLAYVFEFFDAIHATTVSSKADYEGSASGTPANMIQGSKANNFTLQEGSFNTAYNYAYTQKSVVAGLELKKRGFYETVSTDSDYTITRHNGDGTGTRIFIKNLTGAYAISPSGTNKVKMAGMSLTGNSTDPDYYPSFVIPIMVGPYYRVRPLQREELIARSQHLTVTSGTYEKIRWYKTPKFLKTVGIVIIVIATIISFGTATAPVAAAVSAGIAAVTSLAVNFAIQLVVSYIKTRLLALIFEKVAKAIGGDELAMVVAAIATAATAYYTGMTADFSELVLKSVQAGNTFFNKVMGEEVKALNKEASQFGQEYDSLMGTHKEVAADLEFKNVLGLSSINMYKAETPELFFSRAEFDTTELLSSFDALLGLELNLDYMLT